MVDTLSLEKNLVVFLEDYDVGFALSRIDPTLQFWVLFLQPKLYSSVLQALIYVILNFKPKVLKTKKKI